MSIENKAFGTVIALWAAVVLGNLVFWGAVIYTAIHFIHKLW